MFCGAMLEGFACAGELQQFGYHRVSFLPSTNALI
jgi:hypothetical protein